MTWTGIAGFALLLAFGLYILALLRIALGRCRKRATVQSEGEISPLPALLAISEFDCEFATIWQTQVPTLRMLRSAGARGLDEAFLIEPFNCFSRAHPEFCDGSQLGDWVSALEAAEVVERTGTSIRISEKGRFVVELLEHEEITDCNELQLRPQYVPHL